MAARKAKKSSVDWLVGLLVVTGVLLELFSQHHTWILLCGVALIALAGGVAFYSWRGQRRIQ